MRPFESICNLKTPIERIELSEFSQAKVECYVKRDDLIHPFVSGNKWRKLKYNLEKAVGEKAREICTYGGAFSNHLVATAVATSAMGIKSKGIVRGDELSPQSNFVLRLCQEYGMELQFVARDMYQGVKHRSGMDEGVYHIPEGGNNAEGIRGCAEMLTGVKGFDHILVSVGTGATMQGIYAALEPKTNLHGILAVKSTEWSVQESDKIQKAGLHLHHRFSFGGFGNFDQEQLRFNQRFASETGILLDPVYTGKLMRALVQMVEEGYFSSDSRILAIHTGGLTGVLSNKWLNAL